MYFNKPISFLESSTQPVRLIGRTAVRAIIMEQGKILMVHSNLGYYKLPGGGAETGESLTEALSREVVEETGYLNSQALKELGVVSELRPDRSMAGTCFHMDSYYYLCRLTDKEKTEQALIDYELEENYTPVWISLLEAIEINQSSYEKNNSLIFIPRENFILNWLLRNPLAVAQGGTAAL
ncbi:NUDIX domain-containing protein [Planococcus beigongshangi]|uniref:NUDIX domain-containing protein n=1 Tax=Planococcus beigongshangi TaxID=2782536 RepID=UPI00193BC4E1|nr:NUDIX domain-containing protein [Planococcus beigongshangi]